MASDSGSPFNRSATQLLADLSARRISSEQLVTHSVGEIERLDGGIGAFLAVRRDQAIAEAREIDRQRAAGAQLGRLAGLPIAVKDILCTAGEVTTCGSRMLESFVPPYDATVIQRLRAAGAVIVGKVNLDEFAMGGSTENSAFQKTHNPWDPTRTPGGSSGGSAACVAAGMVPWSIGTDTGGSIRQPAAYCGVTGLKPTYGRVSRFGLIAFASSLDQAGPLARTAEDLALLLEVIAGHDSRDSTSAPQPIESWSQSIQEPLRGLRIGLVREHFTSGLSADVEGAVREAVKTYESLGATIHDVSLPHSKYGIATYYIIAPCEASSNLARYDGIHFGYRADEKQVLAELEAEKRELLQRGESARIAQMDSSLVRLYRRTRAAGFGAEVKRRIMLGTYALSAGYYDAYYLRALKVRRLIRNDYDAAFRDVDLLLGPTTPTAAFPLGAKVNDPLAMYLEDLYTVTANLAGIAALSLPCGQSAEGLPIGLQLQAPAFAEGRLLQAAHQFQQATDWHTRRPQLS
ncbi:MAG: Asp-tRNA(Asn)/Glu-tRNA(Gln) amidotransferase subunit GatA [Planctomycetota bacterium]